MGLQGWHPEALGLWGQTPRSYFQTSGPRLGTRLILVALCSQFRPHLGVGAEATEGVGVIL